jgi:acetyl-CoA carboxylase biotin carboxyl carrier protein
LSNQQRDEKGDKKKSRGRRHGGDIPAAGNRAGPMDMNLLEQMVRLMAANDLNTVDVRDGDKRVILKRGTAVPAAAPASIPAAYAPPATAPAAGAGSAPSNTGAGGADDDGLIAIKSPMVGTFYAAATPDAKPFVSVGSRVDEETDVCIIEAMKVFNNIKAECRGTIARILVENGETVEFGQTLFLVKP